MHPEKIIYRNYTFIKHHKQPYYYGTVKQKTKSLHRYMYECEIGPIPEGYHIHHKDDNPYNNTIDNFEIKTEFDHLSYHGKKGDREKLLKLAEIGREFAKEWHGTEEGIAWHKQHYEDFKLKMHEKIIRNCSNCNQLTSTTRKSGNAFCSNKCKSQWRRRNKPDKKKVNCLKCGKEFETLKYLPNSYCSKECKPIPNPKGYWSRK